MKTKPVLVLASVLALTVAVGHGLGSYREANAQSLTPPTPFPINISPECYHIDADCGGTPGRKGIGVLSVNFNQYPGAQAYLQMCQQLGFGGIHAQITQHGYTLDPACGPRATGLTEIWQLYSSISQGGYTDPFSLNRTWGGYPLTSCGVFQGFQIATVQASCPGFIKHWAKVELTCCLECQPPPPPGPGGPGGPGQSN